MENSSLKQPPLSSDANYISNEFENCCNYRDSMVVSFYLKNGKIHGNTLKDLVKMNSFKFKWYCRIVSVDVYFSIIFIDRRCSLQ